MAFFQKIRELLSKSCSVVFGLLFGLWIVSWIVGMFLDAHREEIIEFGIVASLIIVLLLIGRFWTRYAELKAEVVRRGAPKPPEGPFTNILDQLIPWLSMASKMSFIISILFAAGLTVWEGIYPLIYPENMGGSPLVGIWVIALLCAFGFGAMWGFCAFYLSMREIEKGPDLPPIEPPSDSSEPKPLSTGRQGKQRKPRISIARKRKA